MVDLLVARVVLVSVGRDPLVRDNVAGCRLERGYQLRIESRRNGQVSPYLRVLEPVAQAAAAVSEKT